MVRCLGRMLIRLVAQPFLKPILKTATGALGSASAEVIDNNDQYEVFNDPRAVSDDYDYDYDCDFGYGYDYTDDEDDDDSDRHV